VAGGLGGEGSFETYESNLISSLPYWISLVVVSDLLVSFEALVLTSYYEILFVKFYS